MSRSSSGSRSPNRIPASRNTNSNDVKALRCRLFIGNLATDKTSKREVEELFAKYGDITSCSLHNNFGFVQFAEEKCADAAVTAMHGATLFGKRIDVNLAGLRRKTQAKDKYEEPPKKEVVVPPEMMKYGSEKRSPRSLHRSRSPLRGGRHAGHSSNRRSLSPMSRYEELYRRDDQYTRYREYPPYERGSHYPPERRPEPYYSREDPYTRRPAYNDDYRPPYSRSRPAIDCEIVSLSKDESRYADEVESRLRSIGLACNIGYPPPELPITELVNRIAHCGTLYAMVVGPQNATHRSCTLNVLHGTRQEHRNMPLDDALSFVARNFDNYLRLLREPYYPPPAQQGYGARDPPPRNYSSSSSSYQPPVGSSVAQQTEKQLSTEEISAMIEKLKKEKEHREYKEPYNTASQSNSTGLQPYSATSQTNGTPQKSADPPYYQQQSSYYSESTPYR